MPNKPQIPRKVDNAYIHEGWAFQERAETLENLRTSFNELLDWAHDVEKRIDTLERKYPRYTTAQQTASTNSIKVPHDIETEVLRRDKEEPSLEKPEVFSLQDTPMQSAYELGRGEGKRNAVIKEYKDEGVMFILKVEDEKTYEANMPIPKWAEIGKLELRTPDVIRE